MTVSPSKRVCQLFSLSTKPGKLQLQYKGERIEQEDIAKHLGVELDKRLSWNKQVDQMVEKGLK
jgi:hypothetical protein